VSDWRRTSSESWIARLRESGVDRELAGRCAAYVALLARWDPVLNLIGRVDAQSLLRGHLLESLAGAPYLPTTGKLLDIGSGNGFPGVPLLLGEPRLMGVLLEPRERRWGFLKEAVRELGLNAEVVRERIEKFTGEGFAAVTVRALAGRVWWREVERVSVAGAVLLHWTGRGEGAARSGWERVVTSPLPDPRHGQLVVWRRCST
jgi:16S rRNA (guanine527-N7)-methyltransferase